MNGSRIALCSASAITLAGGRAPEWVHLLPAGEIRTNDGRGPYRVTSMSTLAGKLSQRGKLPIDENHATDKGAPLGAPAPARGWIVALQARSDGLWGKVEWTGEGRRLVADKAYAGISPVILHTQAGDVLEVLRASLTNTPNLQGLTALHSAMHPDLREPPLDASDRHVIALMGLDEAEYRASQRRLGIQKATMSVASSTRPQTDRNGLDASDRQIIALMGLSEADYLASKARRSR